MFPRFQEILVSFDNGYSAIPLVGEEFDAARRFDFFERAPGISKDCDNIDKGHEMKGMLDIRRKFR